MIKYIKPAVLSIMLIAFSSAVIAQGSQSTQTTANTIDQPAATPQTKADKMKEYCAKMMQAPKKGFKHSVEWGGIYAGPRNQISYRTLGKTISGDIRERNAVRMSAGYLFNPYVYFGGGMGAEFQRLGYNNKVATDAAFPMTYTTTSYTGSMVLIPIYAEVKGYLLNKPISPFLQYRMGYAPVIYGGADQHIVEHASYNNLSVGVRIYQHMSITAGYLFIYQPTGVSGFDQRYGNSRILDSSNPFQHRVTVGIAMGM